MNRAQLLLLMQGGGESVPATPWYLSVAGVTPTAAYRAIGVADIATSRINLATPGTNDLTDGVAPTFSPVTGWTFNTTTQFLKTGLLAGNTTLTVLIRFSNGDGIGDKALFGAFEGATTAHIIKCSSGGTSRDYYNGGSLTIAGVKTSGVMGFAGNAAYYNGAVEAGTLGAGTASTKQLYIGALNLNDNPLQPCGAAIQAVWILKGTALNAGQIATISTAMAGLTNP